MLICCWSAKGGSGVTVVAAGLALASARGTPTTLVDLCGDLPAALGVAVPHRVGLAEWTRGGCRQPIDELAVPVVPQLRLVPRGDGPVEPVNVGCLASPAEEGVVVVDAGVLNAGDDACASAAAGLVAQADRSLLVLQQCFLALRRATHLAVRPHGVVLVTDPVRALRAADVSDALGVPVVAEVPIHASISRAVDAGLLAARCPKLLSRPLERVR